MELSSWIRASNDLVLVLVITTVLAASTEPLTGANVCHRVENYTETSTESYDEPVRVQTSSWCFAIPPRCWRTRIELRTQYRIKEEVKQKNITECCKGYTLQKVLVNGDNIEKCVSVVNCKPGFIGKNCDVECPEGSWGILCMYTCDCPANRLCNRINGTCDCPPGFTGFDCTDICETGKYGRNCSLDCQCRRDNGSCHHVSGNCSNSTKSIIVTTTNWTVYAPIKMSTTAHPSTIPSPMEPIDRPSNSTIKPDYTSVIVKNSSRISDEIGLDSTVETAIITEHHKANLPRERDSTISTTTGRPIVAVVHVGKTSRENILVTPELSTDRASGHNTVPLPVDVAVVVVIGSILSLGLTTLAVLALLHVRTKLFETIRLSIYDAEKPDGGAPLSSAKGNTSTIRSINRSSTITSCDYETPRCIIPQRPGTPPRPSSEMIRESTYSNQYPNIQLFNSLRELMEAHYDRPPAVSTFRRASNETETEHLYDEIPLQSINFEDKKKPIF